MVQTCCLCNIDENVVLYTKVSISLHNFPRTNELSVSCPPGFVDGEDRAGNVIQGERRDEETCTSLQPSVTNKQQQVGIYTLYVIVLISHTWVTLFL